MSQLPEISNYGDYSSSNYGAHTLRVDISYKLTLWYSYSTVIAFSTDSQRFVSENVWGVTTGKHLNWIDDGNKKNRLPHSIFCEKLQSYLKELGLTE